MARTVPEPPASPTPRRRRARAGAPAPPAQEELPLHSPWLLPAYETAVREVRDRTRRIIIPPDSAFEGELRPYQHDGVAVSYLTSRLLLGDGTGLGKTVQTLRLLQLMRARGELTPARPAVVVVPAGNAFHGSWLRDGFAAFLPSAPPVALSGDVSPPERRQIYAYAASPSAWAPWLLLTYQTLLRDIEMLRRLQPSILVLDEGSTVKSHSALTSHAVKSLAARAGRVLVLTATPIQTQLLEMHSILEVLGLGTLIGTPDRFKREYYNFDVVQRRLSGEDVWTRVRNQARPYKNLDRLRTLVWPYYYRRTFRDIPGEMPELTSRVEWLDLTAGQRRAYDALRGSTLAVPRDSRPGARRFSLQARALYLKQISTSLQTFDPRFQDHSAKLDWVVSHLQGDWTEGGLLPDGSPCPMKIVVYSTWKQTIVTLKRRLDAAGIGSVVMAGKGQLPSGDDFPYGSDPNRREPFRQRFFEDPGCQVLIGTTAIEMSTNLHAAPILVNLDLPTNPGRAEQIAGRVWRRSSPYRFVQVISLMSLGTLELGTLALLRSRQDLIDRMNGDTPGGLFGAFTEAELEQLVTTDWTRSSPEA